MNSESPKTPRQELEASLTALLLGELPADKATALRDLMAKDAELARLYERLEHAIGLVKETAAVPQEQTSPEPALKLSVKKREQLLAHFKTVAPKEFSKPKQQISRLVEIAAVLVIVGVLASVMLPALSKSKSRAVGTLGMGPRRESELLRHGASGQVDVLSAGRPVTEMVARDMTKERERSTVGSVTDQTTARLAAETELEMAQDAIVAPMLKFTNARSYTLSSGQFVARAGGNSNIVLPATTDYAVSAASRGFYEDKSNATKVELGDPQWVGMLEKGNSSPGYTSTNGFIGGYAFNLAPSNPVELAYKTAERSRAAAPEAYSRRYGGAAWDDNTHSKQGGAGLGEGSVQQLSRSKLQEGLRNSSETRTEAIPAIDPATGLPVPVSGVSGTAIDPATGLPMPVEVGEAQGKALTWNGGENSNELFTPEGLLKESAGQKSVAGGGTGGGGGAGGGKPAAANERIPAQTLRQQLQTTTASPQVAREKLAELTQRTKDASDSNIYLGTELARVDENKSEFGTWQLENGQTAVMPAAKKVEESLKETEAVSDGSTMIGRASKPGYGFSLLGPKETPSPQVSFKFDSNGATEPDTAKSLASDAEQVVTLGDRPILGRAWTGGKVTPDATDFFSVNEVLSIPDTNSINAYSSVLSGVTVRGVNGVPTTNGVFGPGANLPSIANVGDLPALAGALQANSLSGYVDASNQWQFATGTPNRGWLGGTATNMSSATGARQSSSNIYSPGVVGYSGIGGSVSNLSAERLSQSAGVASYDRYTHYRLLEQLGTETNKGPEEPKLALNFSNVRGEDRKPAESAKAGDAVFAIDPDTRERVVIADKETSDYIARAVTNGGQSSKEQQTRIRGGVAALQQKFADQPVKVAKAQADVDRLRAQYKIADALATSDAPTTLMSAEALRKIEGQRIEIEAQVMQQEALLAKLKEMPREKLVASLPTTTPDAVLNGLLEQKSSAEQQLIIKQKESGESSPEITRLRSQVSDLNSKIDQQADGILLNLEGRVTATKEQLSKLHDEVERAKTNDFAAAQISQPYWEAKRKLEEEQRFTQVLAMKIASENIESSLPTMTMVEIMDPALPAKSANASLWERLRGKGKFESLARVKVERDQSDVSFVADPRMGAVGYDPYFIQNEFETIKSDKVLGQVVAAMDLQKEWSKGGQTLSTNEAIALLKQKLDLKAESKTSFIDIRAKSDKPQEAAELANAVAKSYQVFRSEQRQQLSLGGIKALEERWKEQEVKVTDAQKEVDRLRAEGALREATRSNVHAAPVQEVDAAPPKPAIPPPVPQPEVQTRENAFSTFSLNVSDVAFKLAAASLEKGQMPDPGGIRSEEFINAFDYRDPEAAAGVPVAFAWERARYPYAQNRDLLRFSIKTAAQGRQAGRPLNIVLLLDNSGSMERADRVAIIREALKVLASQLQPQDKLSVITFARTAQLRVDGVSGNQAVQVAEEIGGLTPEGGTNIEEGMKLAYQTALRHYLANGINRVVLLTDGAANLGNVEPESLKQKVEANRKQGIALDCFGIGWEGYNDDFLEILSRNGDGRYGFINSPEEAATQFAGQLAGALNVAASDVKVQVEFNPARVTAYRQIGYARHQLTKEQFRDNTVDAAEIAAQEAGNALYVIEVNPAGEGPLGMIRVRFKIPGTSDYREHEWTVPSNGNAVALEQASPAMRLAATASAFSEWLASSPYATEVTPDTLLRYLGGVPEVYGADGRPKKLEWMIRQAKSVVGSEIQNPNVETRSKPEESKKDAGRAQFP